ncbi:MAG: hypothetical protein MUF83_19880 [Acidimicrobiales bacterium]|nr:hypothetical protein [Acidimicrobiales bacterium]
MRDPDSDEPNDPRPPEPPGPGAGASPAPGPQGPADEAAFGTVVDGLGADPAADTALGVLVDDATGPSSLEDRSDVHHDGSDTPVDGSLPAAGPDVAAPLPPGEAPTPEAGDEPPGRLDRFVRWWTLERAVSAVVVAGCVLFTFLQLQPGLIFSDTTPAGGDMGAHVWAPAYLRDNLLSQGRLTGWTPDWYAGFPAFHFYMVPPSLAIALLSYVIPYGIAFKLVSVSGVLALPVAAWAFGRLSRMPFPAPPLFAVAAVLFLFDRSFSIYGGNIPSTLAGEFAFSISLPLALVYLGVLGRGLETGRHRALAAVLFALAGLNHLIPFIFAGVGTLVWLAVRPGWGRLRYVVTMGVVGGALTAWWTVPFFLRRGYLNDMGWERITRYSNYLWDRDKLDSQLVNHPDLRLALALAAVGLLLSLVFRRRAGLFLAVMAAVAALGFRYMPEGRLWNARLLPFYYLCVYMLAAVGVSEIGRLLAALFARDVRRPVRAVTAATALIGLAVGLVSVALPLRVLPGGAVDESGAYAWGPLSTTDSSYIDDWARWNFIGYEGTWQPNGYDQPWYQKRYKDYHSIVTTMARLGEERGCGRAMWEHEEANNEYGTPMALMLLPFWTDGCIGSMEGLYFEASATTPYHFMNQDELSTAPSNAQRDLPYGPGAPTPLEFDRGVRHLQMLGVQYYLAISDRMQALADENPDLTRVAESDPWVVYEVADVALVAPLAYEPAVITGVPTVARPWQDVAIDWYVDETRWDVPLAADGPESWQRLEVTEVPPAEPALPGADESTEYEVPEPEKRPLPEIEVTAIETGDDRISFEVSEPGVPVLVKASYFPNWQVSGAEGPYRVTPNLMVVVPTDTRVELSYGWTAVDLGAWGLTLAGLVGLVVLWRLGPLELKPPRRFWGVVERPDLYPPEPEPVDVPGFFEDGGESSPTGPAAPPWTVDGGVEPVPPDEPVGSTEGAEWSEVDDSPQVAESGDEPPGPFVVGAVAAAAVPPADSPVPPAGPAPLHIDALIPPELRRGAPRDDVAPPGEPPPILPPSLLDGGTTGQDPEPDASSRDEPDDADA